MKALLPLMLAALSLGACATAPAAPTPELPQVPSAGFGQQTRVGALVVTPLNLVEDSRCPVNARCVWAGRLVIGARINGPGWSETANLELGKDYRSHGLGLALVSARPDKIAGSEFPPPAYLFGFEPR